MKHNKLKTLLYGFGSIAQGYKNDSVMASKLVWRTHAQVLTEHPAFCLAGVVDPSQEALDKGNKKEASSAADVALLAMKLANNQLIQFTKEE